MIFAPRGSAAKLAPSPQTSTRSASAGIGRASAAEERLCRPRVRILVGADQEVILDAARPAQAASLT